MFQPIIEYLVPIFALFLQAYPEILRVTFYIIMALPTLFIGIACGHGLTLKYRKLGQRIEWPFYFTHQCMAESMRFQQTVLFLWRLYLWSLLGVIGQALLYTHLAHGDFIVFITSLGIILLMSTAMVVFFSMTFMLYFLVMT